MASEKLNCVSCGKGSNCSDPVAHTLQNSFSRLLELLSGDLESTELSDIRRTLKRVSPSELSSVSPGIKRNLITVCNQIHKSASNGEPVSEKLLLDMSRYCESLYDTPPCQESSKAPSTCERITIGKGNSLTKQKNLKPETEDKKVVVYLLEDDEMFVELLSLQLQQFGYETGIFSNVDDLINGVSVKIPDVLICDIVLNGERSTELLLQRHYRDALASIPIIFLSNYDDFQHRLETVRVGGVSYFQKPADVNALSERIDLLTTRRDAEAIKILVVDDSKTQTNLITSILNEAGMYVHAINSPVEALDYLEQNKPDLVLLDINMPVCNGIELATIIRQFDAYLGLPIVYLSTENGMERQLEAMRAGGDDFISKPIKPIHLISTVTSRVVRSRALRSQMMRDSLTGLYNHTTAKERVEHEISRAARVNGSLVFAMIDIDHFKSVNDTYGHPTGDRVIKSLSRMLKQRLRNTDIVGRYGGEEFCVAMIDTDLKQAHRILDEIRESFSSITYSSGDKSFSSTFSCGIAAFPQYETLSFLNDAADRALYTAKGNGRNQVVVFPGSEKSA